MPAVSSTLEDIYSTLTDFAGISGDASDYDAVTSAAIQFGTPSQFLTFDVITSREHSGDTEVTDHPVETGPDVTDNVRPKPYEITLEAFVTATPIVGGSLVSTALNPAVYTPPLSLTPGAAFAAVGQGITALSNAIFGAPSYNAQILTFADPFDSVGDTLTQLQSFHDNATILTLITAECTYDNVIMTSFKLGKKPETGSGATVAMSFKVLTIVQTSVVAAPTPAVVRGAVPLNAGVQAPSPTAGPATQLEPASDLYGLTH